MQLVAQLAEAALVRQGYEHRHAPLLQADVHEPLTLERVDEPDAVRGERAATIGQHVLRAQRVTVAGVPHHEARVDQRRVNDIEAARRHPRDARRQDG